MIQRNGQSMPGFALGDADAAAAAAVTTAVVVNTAVGIGIIVLLIGGVLYFVRR